MTSEVALMNRNAVALAADSAATVSFWQGKERKERYFKGANKIFHLCNAFPVGLMTYQSSSLFGVPWQTLAKAYRGDRGSVPHDRLREYADDFFDFIAKHADIFPEAFQERKLKEGINETAGNYGTFVLYGLDNADDAKKKAEIPKNFANLQTVVNADEFLGDKAEDISKAVRAKYQKELVDEFKKTDICKNVDSFLSVEDLVDLAITGFFKRQWTDLQYTGVVFAGYGEREYFPQLEQYVCYGIVEGQVLRRRLDDECRGLSHDDVSEVVPIAQSEMVNTFMFGSNLPALYQIDQNVETALKKLTDDLVASGLLDGAADTSTARKQALTGFKNETKRYIWKEHALPLRRVIGVLPIDELASLAETFVSIESLKERVTGDGAESVSGPIDVAVITKGDGFIWIKRKHYFDPALNISFVARKNKESSED